MPEEINAAQWSVVIPILNERENLPRLMAEVAQAWPGAEVIVVDGGSRDGSVTWLEENKTPVLHCRPSRGAQIDMGSRAANGEYLFYLHADCQLPKELPDIIPEMQGYLERPGIVAGAFTFKVDSDDPRYRMMEKAVKFRCHKLQMPYGDQGIFLKKETYLKTGGLTPYDIMEDVALHSKLRFMGYIKIMDVPMLSSARRFEKRGYVASNIRNLSLLYLFHAGVPNRILKEIYYFGGCGKKEDKVIHKKAYPGDGKELRRENMRVGVVIPCLDEEKSLPLVLQELPMDILETVIVVDNGCRDASAEVARKYGATVVEENERGYGAACLKGIASLPEVDVAVFVDADYSDHPEDIYLLLDKIAEGNDLVIGSRTLGRAESGALLPQAQFGNALSCFLVKIFFGFKFSDLGPFRAIRKSALDYLVMEDRAFGWTIEMQVKAVLLKMKIAEVSVAYKKRIGVSKITGTLKGTFLAGMTILLVIFRAFYLLKIQKKLE